MNGEVGPGTVGVGGGGVGSVISGPPLIPGIEMSAGATTVSPVVYGISQLQQQHQPSLPLYHEQ